MKQEELKKLKERFEKLQAKRDEVLEIKKEVTELEELEVVKRYLELKKSLKEKTTGRNTGFDKFTDEELVTIALGNTDITPAGEVYVYLGTYKYNCEIDIVHCPSDIPVSRLSPDADYVVYQDLESKYIDSIRVPYRETTEFEASHKIIYPKNVLSREKYFYDVQSEYFETMILESPEKAVNKINRLIKK